MNFLDEQSIACPYCGETITVLINAEDVGQEYGVGQEYIEDCQVCCKPMVFHVETDMSGALMVSVRSENETY